MQSSIETNLAKEQGYPAFMSPEHIVLVLKSEQEKKQSKPEKHS